MTVLSQVSSVSYSTDGVTTGPFTVPFYFLENTDLVVQSTVGTTLTLVLGRDYAVTGAGDPAGGSVTTTVAMPAGTLTIYRDPPIIQPAAYSDHGRFPAASHEKALDRRTMVEQRLKQRADDLTTRIAAAEARIPAVQVIRAENWPNIFTYITSDAVINDIATRQVVDHTAEIQAAMNAKGAGTLWLPDGAYFVASSLFAVNGQTIRGGGKTLDGAHGPVVAFLGAIDQPLISVRAGNAGGIKGCMLIAGANAGTPNQKLVDFDGLTGGECDGFELEDLALFGGYKQLGYRGVCFYQRIKNCTFSLAYKRALSVEGTIASAGVDLYMEGNHFRGGLSSQDYVWYLLGLGSAVTVGNIITVNPAQNATVMLDTLATGFGDWQSTNDVYESSVSGVPSLILGTPTSQVKQVYFDNLDAGGGIDLVNVDAARISGPIASLRAHGEIYVPANGFAENVVISPQLDGDGTKSPVQCGANARIGMSLVAPTWKGAAPLVDFTATTAANIAWLDVIGGNKGTDGTPIRLPAGTIAGLRA
jgi:hypothetical protein